MSFSDDFFDANSNSFIDDEKLKSKVKKCKEYVSNGQTITFLGNIEETIQLCLEYDFTEDGIYLTEAALEISPYSSELWHSKGIFYNNLFEFEKAYISFDKALSLNPNDVEAMINKSISEDNLGMWDDSIKTLENALLIEPKNEEVLFNLGIFYERKDYFERAIEYFSRTVEVDKQYGDAWYELGFCYESNNQLEKASYAYEKFLEIEPYSASGWYNFGIVYLRLSKYDKAINCFELATAINDDFANAWYNCGLAYSKINNYIASRNCFLRAFEIDPFDDLIPLNIAQSYEATGEYKNAEKYYVETLKLSKSNIDAYVGMGNCAARNNNRALALHYFSKILKYTLSNNLAELSDKELIHQLEDIHDDIKMLIDPSNNLNDILKLADLFFEIGNWEKSFSLYKKVEENQYEIANSNYGMALCQFMLDNDEQGISHIIRTFELNQGMENNFLEAFPDLESTHLYIYLTESL